MSTPKKRSTINMNPLNVDVVTETTAGTPKKSPLKAKAVSPDNLSKPPKPTKSAANQAVAPEKVVVKKRKPVNKTVDKALTTDQIQVDAENLISSSVDVENKPFTSASADTAPKAENKTQSEVKSVDPSADDVSKASASAKSSASSSSTSTASSEATADESVFDEPTEGTEPLHPVQAEPMIKKPCYVRYSYQNTIESSRILRNMVTGEWGFYLNDGVFVSLMNLEGPIDATHSKNNFVPLMLAGGLLGGVLGFAAAVFFTRKQNHVFRVKHSPETDYFVSLDRRSLSFLKDKVSARLIESATH
jgi:hypothetical protein